MSNRGFPVRKTQTCSPVPLTSCCVPSLGIHGHLIQQLEEFQIFVLSKWQCDSFLRPRLCGRLLTERPNSHVVNCYVSVELLPTELASWEPSVPKTGKNSEPVSCENRSKPTSHMLGDLTKSINHIHNNRKTSNASLSREAIYSGAKKEVVNCIFHNKLQWGTCEWTIKMAIIWTHEGRIRDYVFIVPLDMQ